MVYHPTGDHLSSTGLVLNASGGKVAEARYHPYGETRWRSGTLPTDYRFTGQREEASLGLYHMGARFYETALGRWLSADTIVPEPGEPQALNRYSYVTGNPMRYTDPSGHVYFDYEKGVLVWNGIPWMEASQNAPEGFDLMTYPDPDPGIQAVPNGDGTYTVYSPDNPTFLYPTEVKGTAKVLRAEIGGELAVPAEKREDAAASVVWVMRNMVERGRCKAGYALTPGGACRSLTNSSQHSSAKTRYHSYSQTWSQFARGSESLREDELVALRVFLGQISDLTKGGVYMINKALYDAHPYLKDKQTAKVTWYVDDEKVGHYFFAFYPFEGE